MKYFDTFKDYYRFATAREFVHKETCTSFPYRHNRMEKIGEVLVSPYFKPGDFILKNIRNPLFITAAVVMGLALTTLVFYPEVIPAIGLIALALKSWVYLLTQSAIAGLGLRTLGRLNNAELMSSWVNRKLQPVPMGAVIVRQDL